MNGLDPEKLAADADKKEIELFIDFMRRVTRAREAGVPAAEAAEAIYPDVYEGSDEQ